MTIEDTAYDEPMVDVALPDGTVLLDGQFVINRRLSAGGFGITYLAEDTTLGRTIVIKECYPDDFCLRDGNDVIVRNAMQGKQFRSIVDMFMREARSLAKLRHSNIVGVHRAFEENKTAYMALDLIDGHDLLDIMESSTALLTPNRVTDILTRLLQAVDTIHDHDLLHRDISPDNIIIEKNGTPVLIDFGAARGDASRRTRAISAMLVVKDGYSPQEFYLAGSIQTPSSDLYALGSTFYHVLSGEAPPNSQIRMAEVAGQNPDPCIPLAGRIEGYAPEFLQAIDQAMQVLPRDRIQSAAEWLEMIKGTQAPFASAPDVDKPVMRDVMSQDLERSLSRLIEETNHEVTKAQSVPEIVREQKPNEQPKTRIPEWAGEFNEETANDPPVRDTNLSRGDDADGDAGSTASDPQRTRVVYTAPSTEKTEPDWVVRALERQERERLVREERERQMMLADAPSRGRKSVPKPVRKSVPKPARKSAPRSAIPAPKDDVEARFDKIQATLAPPPVNPPYIRYSLTVAALIATAFVVYSTLTRPNTQLPTVLSDLAQAQQQETAGPQVGTQAPDKLTPGSKDTADPL